MSRIFISYDRDDRPFTRQLANRLRRVYGQVWFDENLTGGVDWWNEIRNQIAACDIFMYLLTETSIISPYCQAEYAEAARLNKQILPVRIAPIDDVPDPLRQIQYVDMSEGEVNVENFTELNAAIKQLSDRAARSSPTVRTAALAKPVQKPRFLRWWWLLLPLLVILLSAGIAITAPAPAFEGQILFTRGRTANREIYALQGGWPGRISSLLSNNPRRIAANVAGDSPLALSPDGRQIAFASVQNGNLDIFVMNTDGSSPRPLTQDLAVDTQPSWSPDGSQIVFSSNRDGDYDLYIIDANCESCEPFPLTSNAFDDQWPSWSRDNLIAFASNRDNNWDIYTIDAALASTEINVTNCPVTDEQAPTWSPDGQKIAFMSNRAKLGPGSVPGGCGTSRNPSNWDIYVINTRLNDIDTVTSSPVPDQYPAWSPDGESLVFMSVDRNGSNTLYVVNISEPGRDFALFDNPDNEGFPIWQP